jgi:uncharacterized protein (TIGR03066 family)
MKTIITVLSLCAALVAIPANAEIKLKDNSQILGKWQVTAEATALDKEKKPLHVVWDFQNNGTLMTTSEDSLGRTSEMEIGVKYSVENGVIKKQTSPGREKYEECTVLELNAKDMVLKCKFLYFFLTRK